MRVNDVPHGEIIVPNGRVSIPSIFMFEDATALYSFLYGCTQSKCEVHFENENIDVLPDDGKIERTAKLFCYSSIISCRKIGDDYVRYVKNKSNMNWGDVK